MIHYLTSYAQPLRAPHTSETPLSPLGVEQAHLLGARLAALGFGGCILSAPDHCALETARILATHTGSEIQTVAWLGTPTEGEIAKGYQAAVAEYPAEDVLFLGHHATCEQLMGLMEYKHRVGTRQYNCALSIFNPLSWKFVPTVYDTAHLPYEKTTLDGVSREALDRAAFATPFEGEIPLPDLSQLRGERILHIGDTESATYPYYRKLIELVRPDVILHTGDLADEVKIGRELHRRDEYVQKSAEMLSMMRASGARVILVSGNHDLPEEIARLAPEAELYIGTGEVTLDGVPCRIGHRVDDMVFDRQYCFYGHGMAHDPWRWGFNQAGGQYRFNVAFGSFICDLASGVFLRIPRPTLVLPCP